MKELDWLAGLNSQVRGFLLAMRGQQEPGYFRYSYSSDRFDEDRHWNVGSSVFALKILYCLDWQEPEIIGAASTYIQSFMRGNGEIYDDLIFYRSLPRAFLASVKNRNFGNLWNQQYKLAETRQCYSALALHGALPNRAVVLCPLQASRIDDYLAALAWQQPWAAGSHFSHLLFFLNLAYQTAGINQATFCELRQRAIGWVNRLQSPVDGSWYAGEVSDRQKINGAMKVITGLVAADQPVFAYPERLVDLCLRAVNDDSACDHFNIVYVLHYASKLIGGAYRKTEIERFCLDRLAAYHTHFHAGLGGFSFHVGQNNTRYYGAHIAGARREPDIHGTVMFLWGISILLQLLGISERYGLQEFKT